MSIVNNLITELGVFFEHRTKDYVDAIQNDLKNDDYKYLVNIEANGQQIGAMMTASMDDPTPTICSLWDELTNEWHEINYDNLTWEQKGLLDGIADYYGGGLIETITEHKKMKKYESRHDHPEW